jgi:hypothetical protein
MIEYHAPTSDADFGSQIFESLRTGMEDIQKQTRSENSKTTDIMVSQSNLAMKQVGNLIFSSLLPLTSE